MKNLKKLSRNKLKTGAGAGGIIGEPIYGACIKGYTWCPNKQKCVLGTIVIWKNQVPEMADCSL